MTTHDLTRTPPPLLRRARLAFFLVAVVVPVVDATSVAVVPTTRCTSYPATG